ncbi:glycoside hydrolase family 13 protein [Atractiella rhizophila]|nr:glycoside hydrolase family 13 protein [Atractiella rhizophila]
MATDANKEYSTTKYQNYTMLQAFEWYSPSGGTHWKWLGDKMAMFGDMGITGAWIPPPCKASAPKGNGYDIYDLFDLGEFDQKGSVATKWGTKDELVETIRKAKDAGIVCYIDAVLNHKAGADFKETFNATEVDSDDRTKEISDAYDIEGWTGFNFPGRGDKYSSFKWDFNHFTGVDYDDKTKKNSIFRIKGDGKNWSRNVDREKGNFDYLMFADIDHSHPDVEKHLNDWGDWVIKETGANGFRFDAVRHMDLKFVAQFVKHARETAGQGSIFAVGEFWKDSVDDMDAYLNKFGQQFSLFDTPLHYKFKEASEQGANYDLSQIFEGTLVQRRSTEAVTLVDNHDTQPYQTVESWVQPWFKPLAYALILLRNEGYPCVFMGDLRGCNRYKESDVEFSEPVSQLEDFVRDGCAVVMGNGDDGEKRMEVGKEHAGEKWTDVLGWFQGEVTIEEDGWATFKCHGRSVSIWTKTDARGRDEFKQ